MDGGGMDHRAVLHRMEACGREPRRGAETARTRPASADPDERRVITQLAEGGRRRAPAGELPRSWKAAGWGGGGSFFLKNAVMCWRRCATFIITTRWRENRQCRRNNGCASIRIIAGR